MSEPARESSGREAPLASGETPTLPLPGKGPPARWAMLAVAVACLALGAGLYFMVPFSPPPRPELGRVGGDGREVVVDPVPDPSGDDGDLPVEITEQDGPDELDDLRPPVIEEQWPEEPAEELRDSGDVVAGAEEGPTAGPAPTLVIEPPRLVHLPPPRYPPIARRARREATVRLAVTVDERGRVVDAEVVGGEVGLGFDEAAQRAARRARFQPGSRDGRPVEMQTNLTIRFRLD